VFSQLFSWVAVWHVQNASTQKGEMEELSKKASAEREKLEKRKGQIDKELAEIEPMVQEAKSAVGNIKTETLGEIRALRAPPDTIRDILEGVLRVMGNPDTSWLAMKRSVNKIYYTSSFCTFCTFLNAFKACFASDKDVTSWFDVYLDEYSFLAKRGVKEEIQTFDARKITPETRKAVEALLKKNRDSFDPKVSIAGKCDILYFLLFDVNYNLTRSLLFIV